MFPCIPPTVVLHGGVTLAQDDWLVALDDRHLCTLPLAAGAVTDAWASASCVTICSQAIAGCPIHSAPYTHSPYTP